MFALLQLSRTTQLNLFPFGEVHGGGLKSGYDYFHRVDGIKVIRVLYTRECYGMPT